MPYFGESPLERIVDVHWKKKDDGEPPDDGYPPPYCGRYFYRSDVVSPNESVASGWPPFVGTFRTDGITGADGNQYGFMSRPLNPELYQVLTAKPFNLFALPALTLNADTLSFTNIQLIGIPSSAEPLPGGFLQGCSWIVPMANGYTNRIPMIVKSYHITFEWASVPTIVPADPPYPDISGEDLLGLGITHPLPSRENVPIKAPPEPFMQGAQLGGALSFEYDFKWREWIRNEIPVNPGNQYDPTLGGPALVFVMHNKFNPNTHTYNGWVSLNTVAESLGTVGSFTQWEVRAECMQMPSIFG